MPLLTPATLADLARRTRRYLHGAETCQATLDELGARRRPDDRSGWLLVFGAAEPPQPPPSRRLCAVGLGDPARRSECGFAEVGVRPIEDHLAAALAEYPSAKGYDL